MLGRLFVLFVLVPILELWLLVRIGGAIGGAATLALVVVTAIAGAAMARREGTRVLSAWQAAMERGEIPEEGVVSSLLILVGGILLVVPGVITDVVGLALLVPPTRRAIARAVQRRVQHHFELRTLHVSMPPWADLERGDVIDVQATERPATEDQDPRAATDDPRALAEGDLR